MLLALRAAVAGAQEFSPPAHHARIEAVARDTAYQGGNERGDPPLAEDPALRADLETNALELLESIDDRDTGMQAMVLRDGRNGQT